MKIIFFGTPQFAADTLCYLLEKKVNIVAVVSKPDRPKGRSGKPQATPVKEAAQQHGIPVYQPEIASAIDFAETLRSYDADLFIVVAYGEIVKQHLLDMPKRACINLHASLLPAYRGAAPIHRCLINGEKETGVTIMHMVKKMDAGDMIRTAKLSIGSETTFEELQHALCEVGKKLLYEVIEDFERGDVTEMPQDHEKATFAPRMELEDCEVHWDQSAKNLHNLIRGSSPTPGAWCYVLVKGEKKRLKIYRSCLVDSDEGLVVSCKEGLLKLLDVQLEGKKRMSADELMRGVPDLRLI